MFNLSCFIGKRYFDDDESQNYLIFQPVFDSFEILSGTIDKTIEWKSTGLPQRSISTSITPGNPL